MKILLISPSSYNIKTFSSFILSPMLGLYQIKAVTPQNHNITIINENQRNINFNKRYDLVGISCMTPTANRAYEIAKKFKEKGAKVVLGGWHPTVMPNEAKKHADTVVIGEVESVWNKLLIDLENEKLKNFYQSKKTINPANLPQASRPRTNELIAEIQATRGCSYKCYYCVIPQTKGLKKLRYRPVDSVIDEIKQIKQKILIFQDSSITSNPTYAKQLFKKMIGLNKKFICDGNVFVLNKEDEILALARKAGCISWSTGLELNSCRHRILNSKKIMNEYIKSIKKIKNHGMSVTEFFWFGFDSDEKNIFDKTIDLISRCEFDSADFCYATPFPGTKMYKDFVKQKRIISYDWSKYNLRNVVFKPKNMTVDELLNGTINVNEYFYKPSLAFKRIVRSINLNFYSFLGTVTGNLFSLKLF